jgi:short-subunit dehydrogenase
MMAEGFVRNGAKVYISSRKKDACDETAAELTLLGPGSCHAAPADLSSEEGAAALTQFVASRERKVHVLVSGYALHRHGQSVRGIGTELKRHCLCLLSK